MPTLWGWQNIRKNVRSWRLESQRLNKSLAPLGPHESKIQEYDQLYKYKKWMNELIHWDSRDSKDWGAERGWCKLKTNAPRSLLIWSKARADQTHARLSPSYTRDYVVDFALSSPQHARFRLGRSRHTLRARSDCTRHCHCPSRAGDIPRVRGGWKCRV